MFPAAKHFDPVVDIDVHIVMLPTPAGPVPTPVPVPFVGFIFDPIDYVPGLGATVFINGLPRANAGTAAVASPVHVPMGGPFLKPPGNEGELFMGSSTVLADGEPLGYAGLPVLTCQDIGMPAPFRPTKQVPVLAGSAGYDAAEHGKTTSRTRDARCGGTGTRKAPSRPDARTASTGSQMP